VKIRKYASVQMKKFCDIGKMGKAKKNCSKDFEIKKQQ
jgi:hypothetical protein